MARYLAELNFGPPLESAGLIVVSLCKSTLTSPHRHLYLDELFIALTSAIVHVEGKTVSLEQGDAVLVERGEAHSMEARDSPAVLFAVKLPNIPTDKVDV